MASNPVQRSDVSLDYLSFSQELRPDASVPNPGGQAYPACRPLLKPAPSLLTRPIHTEKAEQQSTSPISSAHSSPVTESSSASNIWDSSVYSNEEPLSAHSVDSYPDSPATASCQGRYPTSAGLAAGSRPEADSSYAFGPFDDWMGWNDLSVNALNPLSPVVKSESFPRLEPRSPGPSAGIEVPSGPFNPEFIDENTVAFQDTLSEEPLFQTPAQNMESPQAPSRLYSTPLSWERPQPGYHNVNAARQYTNLTPAEESQLLSIAMPRLAPAYSRSSLSPSPELQQTNRRKRKSSSSSISSSSECDQPDDSTVTTSSQAGKASAGGRHPPPKKTAHNMIEKRYRTNLNDKIAQLRDSVPSLRVATKSEDNSNEDLQGLTPAHKLNKATVLSKATEYIAHLEKRNRHLSKENTTLKQRIEAFEILLQQNPGLVSSGIRIPGANPDMRGRERMNPAQIENQGESSNLPDKRSRYQ
ncbi:MAG: hypothetical protein M1818_002552 [Claussenomyces sp. TS43310]|nr:MAG: hypothetical protein M1818_002552 [Claussenomyces sp. TS43310]